MNSNQAENLVDKLPTGYSTYLKIATDPYHDRQLRFEGAPTSRNATSVCLCLNQEQTFTAEDFGITFATQPSWDAHFVMYPFLNTHEMSYAARVENQASNTFGVASFAAGTISPLNIQGVPSGTPTYASDTGATPLQWKGLNNSSLVSFISNPSADDNIGLRTLRIVGESFEVIDESPEIYQQGAVTVYRYPLDATPSEVCLTWVANPQGFDVDPTFNATITTPYEYYTQKQRLYQLRAPPSNTSQAVLVSGSETWKAREGCYVIGTQYESEVPFKQCDSTPFVFCSNCPSSDPNFETGLYSFVQNNLVTRGAYVGGASSINNTVLNKPDICSPFNLSGAYFTGLSSQYGALRLRYRIYVEILSDPSDTTLIPLASTTLPYNQLLQEMVMDVISKMPAGVPQYMNAGGVNWRNVLKSVGNAAEKLAGPLSALSPEVGLILQGGGRLLSVAGRSKGKKDKQGSQKQQKTPVQKGQIQPSIRLANSKFTKGKNLKVEPAPF